MADEHLRMFVFFSELLHRRVVDERRTILGKVSDFKVGLGDLFPKVEAIVVKKRRQKQPVALPWETVQRVDAGLIVVADGADLRLIPLEITSDELLLREEILDKQVVDTSGAKIERANDLHLLINNGELRLVHVDVGIRGIIRRLGWTRYVDAITNWLFAYQIPQKLISWKFVQPLAPDQEKKRLKLNVSQRKLSEIHPADLADIIEELDRHKATAMFHTLDVETQAEALEELNPKIQRSLIETVDPERASDILEEMAPDEATDLLQDISEENKKTIIRGLEEQTREELTTLLNYPAGSAGSIMTVEFFSTTSETTVAEAIESLKKIEETVEMFYYVYIVDSGGHPIGAISLRTLLLNDPATPLEKIMRPHLVTVRIDDDQKDVLEKFKKYDFLALPVVDDQNVLQGIITLKDAIRAVHPELMEA